ncbi:MAG TPA: hypothetical protein VFQ61_29510 [Polyangiaceae bacterium]|nr:hypothetical protein [Polyangiaceae bacterium]
MTADFSKVVYGYQPSECTPRFTPAEPDGIKIAMPSQIQLSTAATVRGKPALPLCISMRFSALYLEQFDPVFRFIQVVVIDDAGKQAFAGGIFHDRLYRPSPPSDIPEAELAKRIAYKYGTVNLLEFFALPEIEATYHIHVLLKEHRSNVITVQVEP